MGENFEDLLKKKEELFLFITSMLFYFSFPLLASALPWKASYSIELKSGGRKRLLWGLKNTV